GPQALEAERYGTRPHRIAQITALERRRQRARAAAARLVIQNAEENAPRCTAFGVVGEASRRKPYHYRRIRLCESEDQGVSRCRRCTRPGGKETRQNADR